MRIQSMRRTAATLIAVITLFAVAIQARAAIICDPPEPGEPGESQQNPVLPSPQFIGRDLGFVFFGAQSGRWFDPPVVDGFRFEMLDFDGTLFAEIMDFPTGFANPFTVSVNGLPIGNFEPGQSVDFTSFPGGGVFAFEVTNINPNIDFDPLGFPFPISPDAFPLQIAFTDCDPTAFRMTPLFGPPDPISTVPEPASLAIWGLGALGLASVARRRLLRSK